MPKERTSVRDLQNIITTFGEYSPKLRKINELTNQFQSDLTEKLDVFVQQAGEKWNKISNVFAGLSKEDQAKLKVMRPNANYLSKYKLLALTKRTPKPGDPFVDLVTCNGPAFVWSPKDHEKFRAWRKDATPNRPLVYADSGELFINGKIEDLSDLDPNVYLVTASLLLRKW